MNLKEEFQVHDKLNPKLFDEDGKLLEDVRNRIIEIVFEFEKYIEVPIDIIDIQLVGSNASYNYTEKSDVDIHIIANFDNISNNTELLQSLYNEKRHTFNDDVKILIKDMELEIYVENVNSGTISNGIYSICDNDWVKKPKKISSAHLFDVSADVLKWKEKIFNVLGTKNSDNIKNTINALYLLRKNSIALEGEYGKGNQLFKELRNLGYIDLLKDAYNDLLSKKLTLEKFNCGTIVNRLEG